MPPDLPIPREIGDLSPQWLTAVLRRHAPEVSVTSFEVVDSHSGTTGRALLELAYAGDRGPLPRRVFCKLEPFDPRQRALLRAFGIGAVEARFYAELAGEIGQRAGVRVPTSWHAQYDDDGAFIMVLEDLGGAGCRFRRPAPGEPEPGVSDESDDGIGGGDQPALDQASATVDALAALHAHFWESDRFSGDLSWVPERAGFGDGKGRSRAAMEASASFVRKAVAKFQESMPPVFKTVGEYYASHVADVLDLWDEGERTFVHGDPHQGNLFDDGDRAGFYDWAMCSRSPGVRDLAYFCCTSLPTALRRSIQSDLIARYREALMTAGVRLDARDCERQYRTFAVFAWVSMAATAAMGDRWQPVPAGLEALARVTSAVEDLSSLDVLADSR